MEAEWDWKKDSEWVLVDMANLEIALIVDQRMLERRLDLVREAIVAETEAAHAAIQAAETLTGDDDVPIPLKEALCLSELGGSGPGAPSRTISDDNLRAEIRAGRLQRVAPFDKNWRVSRRTIREWLNMRHTNDVDHPPAAARTDVEVKEIRKRQKGTRSSLAADRVEQSTSAVDAARLRITQGRDRLK